MSGLGHAVRVLRTSHGLTQKELAAKAEVSGAYLSQIETGQKEPSMGTLRRLADALHTSAEQLLGLAEQEPENMGHVAMLSTASLRDSVQENLASLRRAVTTMGRSGSAPSHERDEAGVPVPASRRADHFREARAHAVATLRDHLACQYLAAHAEELVQGEKGHRLGDVLPDLRALVRLLRAYSEGQYRAVEWESLVLAVAGLRYFVAPQDVVPDFLHEGHLDDAAVLAFVVEMIAPDLDAFTEWETQVESPG